MVCIKEIFGWFGAARSLEVQKVYADQRSCGAAMCEYGSLTDSSGHPSTHTPLCPKVWKSFHESLEW